MKMFKLDKYKNDQLDESYTIPTTFISVLTSILPSTAVNELKESGFDFNALIEASKHHQAYHSSTTIEEKGIKKRIEINLL